MQCVGITGQKIGHTGQRFGIITIIVLDFWKKSLMLTKYAFICKKKQQQQKKTVIL